MYDDLHRNEVHLVGRLAAPAVSRALPSGDSRVTWRLVVRRPRGRAAPGPPVDTVDCGTWAGTVQQAALAWVPGVLLEVTGSLHRRFWRSGGAVVSRYEVDVSEARAVGPSAAPDAAGAPPGSTWEPAVAQASS